MFSLLFVLTKMLQGCQVVLSAWIRHLLPCDKRSDWLPVKSDKVCKKEYAWSTCVTCVHIMIGQILAFADCVAVTRKVFRPRINGTRTHARTHPHTHRTHTCVRTHARTHTHSRTHARAHTHTHTRAHAYTRMYTYDPRPQHTQRHTHTRALDTPPLKCTCVVEVEWQGWGWRGAEQQPETTPPAAWHSFSERHSEQTRGQSCCNILGTSDRIAS